MWLIFKALFVNIVGIVGIDKLKVDESLKHNNKMQYSNKRNERK